MHIIFCIHYSLFVFLFRLIQLFLVCLNCMLVSNSPDSLIPTKTAACISRTVFGMHAAEASTTVVERCFYSSMLFRNTISISASSPRVTASGWAVSVMGSTVSPTSADSSVQASLGVMGASRSVSGATRP